MSGELLVSCLCVTHERPEFVPWVRHQFDKQGAGQFAELVIVDSSSLADTEHYWPLQRIPLNVDFVDVRSYLKTQVPIVRDDIRHVGSGCPSISEKRTEAIRLARAPFITWFDDDDWQAPDKLARGIDSLLDGHSAVGSRYAYMYSIATGRAALYESTYEPIIFNSAVYRKSSVPQSFNNAKITGEDTEWHERWLQSRPSYVTLGEPMHAWLCHSRNITNKATSRSFELANPIPFDEWELSFLAGMRRRNF